MADRSDLERNVIHAAKKLVEMWDAKEPHPMWLEDEPDDLCEAVWKLQGASWLPAEPECESDWATSPEVCERNGGHCVSGSVCKHCGTNEDDYQANTQPMKETE